MKNALLILAFVLLSFSSFCQERVDKQTIIKSLKNLRTSLNLIDSASGVPFKTQKTSVTMINNQILAINQTDLDYPKEYQTSIDYIKTITGQLDSSSKKNSTLSLIQQDLMLKFKVKDGSSLSSAPNNDMASVSVVTKGTNGQVPNLRVKCSPIGFAIDFTKPLFSFSQLTSPASDQLVPGIYLFWITKDGDNKVLGKLEKPVKASQINQIEIFIP